MTTFFSPPQLDHVFVTVDSQTLKGINDSQFLAQEEFGRFLIREAESTLLGRYQPTRVFGENTLVEIFPDRFGSRGNFKEAAAGVIFSFDQVGQTAVARRMLEASGISFDAELVQRVVPSASGQAQNLPWYVFTRPDMGEGSAAALFFHELTPEYFARIGAACDDSGRQNRSDHFNAVLKKPHTSEYLMQDIVGVTIHLGRRHIEQAASILTTLGYARHNDDHGVHLQGPTAKVTFLPGEASINPVKLKIRISRPMPGLRFDFSPSSSLVLSPLGVADHFATWTFIPPVRPLALREQVTLRA